MKFVATVLVAALSFTSFAPRAFAGQTTSRQASAFDRLEKVLALQSEVADLNYQIASARAARSAAAGAAGTTIVMTVGLAALTGALSRAANGSVTGLIFVIPTLGAGAATLGVGATAVGSGIAFVLSHRQLLELEKRLVRIQALLEVKEDQLRSQM